MLKFTGPCHSLFAATGLNARRAGLAALFISGAAPAWAQSSAPAELPPSCDSPSLAAYTELQKKAPALFKNLGNWQQKEIQVVLDRGRICVMQEQFEARYSKHLSKEAAHSASRVGVVLEDPEFLVLREAVILPGGKEGLHDRKINRASLDGGVAAAYCLPLQADGRLTLIREYRHQDRAWVLSLVGGPREPKEVAQNSARRWLLKESGLSMGALQLMGEVDAQGDAVPLFMGQVTGTAVAPKPAGDEAVAGIVTLAPAELRAAVVRGNWRDSQGHLLKVHGSLATALVLFDAWQHEAMAAKK